MTLADFLVKAKRNTYASGGELLEKKYPDGTREFIYQEKEWKYRDRYYGFDPFVGQEIVWRREKIVWVMNYCGKILESKPSPETIYQFLREAMKKVDKLHPFRGPSYYKKEKFFYRNRIKGDIRLFKGKEEIFFNKRRVYLLNYHGGYVK